MRLLPRPDRPSVAVGDAVGFLRERRPHRWWILALAVVATLVLMWMVEDHFYVKREYKPPVVTYVGQWRNDRPREAIVAQQAKDKPAQDARLRAEREAALERQRQFQRVADMMGIDYKK